MHNEDRHVQIQTKTNTNGTIKAGAVAVKITNTGAAAGTIQGSSYDAGEVFACSVPPGEHLQKIVYNCGATTFRIEVMR